MLLVATLWVASWLVPSLVPWLGPVLGPAPAFGQTPESDDSAVRLEMPLFGDLMQVEVRDAPRTEALEAVRQALLEMHEFAAYASSESLLPGSLGEVNRKAGQEVAVTEPIFEFLLHSLRYCFWSSGVQGPLGGEIYRLWEKQRLGKSFSPMELRDAVASADCSTVHLRQGPPATVSIEEESRLTGYGMERGFAMDLAVAELRRHGIENAIVETGELIRAFGPGPEGKGWLVQVPGLEGTRHPIDQIYLQDQALAWVVRPDDGQGRTPINQLTGVPTLGVRLVAAVTLTAADAEALAHTLYAMGHVRGQRHVGALDPRPSVLWLLGTGSGLPLESPYRWSELERVRRPR